MTSETPDLRPLTPRLDAIADRLQKLEVQVRAVVTSPTLQAKEFVLRDDRGEIRARLEIADYSPRLTFYDRLGKARLHVGLQKDGSPDIADFGGAGRPGAGG